MKAHVRAHSASLRARCASKGERGKCSLLALRAHGGTRRGAVLVAVMICLVLISLVTASLLRTAAAQHRQMRQNEWDAQAEWLAESALERAAIRLGSDADYLGETWNVPADEMAGPFAAAVTLRIAAGEKPRDRVVTATAEYPAGSPTAVRRTKQLTVTLVVQN